VLGAVFLSAEGRNALSSGQASVEFVAPRWPEQASVCTLQTEPIELKFQKIKQEWIALTPISMLFYWRS
jgi:hypothetical protein